MQHSSLEGHAVVGQLYSSDGAQHLSRLLHSAAPSHGAGSTLLHSAAPPHGIGSTQLAGALLLDLAIIGLAGNRIIDGLIQLIE